MPLKKQKFLIVLLLACPIILLLLIFIGRLTRGPSDVEKMIVYKSQVNTVEKQWDKFGVISLSDKSLPAQMDYFVAEYAKNSLTDAQKQSLTQYFQTFFRAFSSGTFADYKAFRLPDGIPFHWLSNSLGSINIALKNGNTIALPKALDRWSLVMKQHNDWSTNSEETNFINYLKLYSGPGIYSNYLTGISADQSRIIINHFESTPVPPAWETNFKMGNTNTSFESYAVAKTQFLNLGYMSQKFYTFVKFDENIETILSKTGGVDVA